MTLDIGSVIHNRYRIARLVGQGGFGAVYRAWDMALSQPVALKENVDSGPESQRQFEQEARLLAGLRHPNLPRVIDHFILPDQGQYLVMDFIEGRSLAQMLRDRGGPLNEAEARQWIHQICEAVEYLHTRTPPIIHRDIKPDNIIVTAEGRAMLVDFGISKLYDAQRGTTVGARAITPGYSPPEQYGFGKTDARSDVYALGATLYTLLTGQTPPEAIDIISESQVLTPVQQINSAVSGATAQAIIAAMNPSISQRLASAARFEQALAERAAPPTPTPQPPLAARQAQQPFAAPAQAPAKSRKQRGCMLGGAAIAGLVIGALAMLALLVWLISVLSGSSSSSVSDFASTATPFVVATPNAALLSGNYVSVTDVSGALSAEMPVEWGEVDGSNWFDASGVLTGAHLTVAPSISALHGTYNAPGVDLLASALLSDGGQANLDFYKGTYATACTYDGRFDTSFGVYTGVYDTYTGCTGQGNIYVAAGTAADGSHVVIFQCQYVTQAELEVCNHILDSVAVAGALPQ